MKKLVFVFALMYCICGVYAQSFSVKKSDDTVVIGGKSYYVHVVQSQQTMYAISKAYGVDVETIMKVNEKRNNELAIGEILTIPALDEDKAVPNSSSTHTDTIKHKGDDKYYYHSAVAGETIYSIARFYGVKVRRLLKYNETYDFKPLSIGNEVKIAWADMNTSVKGDLQSKVARESYAAVTETNKANDFSVKNNKAEGLDVVESSTYDESSRYIHELYGEKGAIREKYDKSAIIKIVVMLPIFINDHKLESEFSERSDMFIRYYESLLLAVDSMKTKGYNIDLYVIDTDRSVEKTYAMVNKINEINPHLIIGPVYKSVYEVIVNSVENKNIPVVYPLSTNNIGLEDAPNSIQCNAPFKILGGVMLNWLRTQKDTCNIINLTLENSDIEDQNDRIWFRDAVKSIDAGIVSVHWDMKTMNVNTLRSYFSIDKENIVVLPFGKEGDVTKLLSMLSALKNAYKIRVLGLPEWQSFKAIAHETYYDLNVTLFTHSYIDYRDEYIKQVAKKFRNYFNLEPDPTMLKMYDMGLYFMDMVCRYHEDCLDAIELMDHTSSIGHYKFRTSQGERAKVNKGFYFLQFTSDYKIEYKLVE